MPFISENRGRCPPTLKGIYISLAGPGPVRVSYAWKYHIHIIRPLKCRFSLQVLHKLRAHLQVEGGHLLGARFEVVNPRLLGALA